MRVLGIDPGLNTTGYGVLDFVGKQPRLVEAGVVRGKRGASLAQCGQNRDIMPSAAYAWFAPRNQTESNKLLCVTK